MHCEKNLTSITDLEGRMEATLGSIIRYPLIGDKLLNLSPLNYPL